MRTALTLATIVTAGAAMADTPLLTVYVYDSFASEWGPGPQIESGFEATCACDVQFVAAGDGAALLSRVMLEGAQVQADVVVGLDNFLMERARESGLFARHGLDMPANTPEGFSDDTFLPFDWGWFAFVGGADIPAPGSLAELAASDLTVVIQDPRSSTPGLGLVLWVAAAYGENAPAFWTDLADNILTVTPGWSEAYALFTGGEADAVLSYSTSPAYHVLAEGDETKVAWSFADGHLAQVEVAALVAASDQPDLGKAFLAYLTGPEAQAVIPETNWMFPVLMPEGGLPAAFSLGGPFEPLILSPFDAAAMRDQAVEDWRGALAQ